MQLVWLLAAVLSSSMALNRLPADDDPIIVVGGGLAGLSATIEIVNHGGKVILIDSQKDVGGNSAKASSGINGCGTAAQKLLKLEDSPDKFYADTLAAGDRENNPSLVDTLVHESADAVQFLIDHGVNLMDINLCGGHSVPRTHWIPSPKEGKPMPVGVTIIRALKQKVLDLQAANPDAVTIKLETEVYGLVTWNDYVTGVNVAKGSSKREEIKGKAVILATGGFSNDHEKDSLLAEFAPKMLKFPTTNGPFATGSGVKIARAMGAKLVDMQYVQVHPTAFIDPAQPTDRTKFLAAEALRGKGAILLNDKGVRFGNELGRRDYLTERILEDCALDNTANAKVAYMVMNEEAVQSFGPPAFNFYWKIKKFFTKVENVGELAKHIGADESKVKASLTAYNEAADSGKDKFGKTVFPVKFNLDEPFYVSKVTPANHYTMGGVKITRDAKVLKEDDGEPFNGLYGAGEVTGGVHGKNRLAGNSLLECVVFGRIAGISAANLRYTGHQEL